TRSKRDWSSDVCSSDLQCVEGDEHDDGDRRGRRHRAHRLQRTDEEEREVAEHLRSSSTTVRFLAWLPLAALAIFILTPLLSSLRSEERRVGKEGRTRWA